MVGSTSTRSTRTFGSAVTRSSVSVAPSICSGLGGPAVTALRSLMLASVLALTVAHLIGCAFGSDRGLDLSSDARPSLRAIDLLLSRCSFGSRVGRGACWSPGRCRIPRFGAVFLVLVGWVGAGQVGAVTLWRRARPVMNRYRCGARADRCSQTRQDLRSASHTGH